MPKNSKYEKNFFLKEIEKILGNSFLYTCGSRKLYKELPKSRKIYIEYNTNGITFEQLEKLSILLKTKKINFTGRTDEFQYSEYTSDTELGGEIEIYDVVFPEEKI